MNNYDEFIAAIDDYRVRRDDWKATSERSGFYDPCGHAEKHAKDEISVALERLDKVFEQLVRAAQHPCGCPDQPLA